MDPQGYSPTPEQPVRVSAEHCLIRVTAWSLSRDGGPHQVRRLLRSQILEYLDGPALDEVEVVVSELATNAFVHTDGPCEMRLISYAGSPIACEIVDTGDQEDLVAKRLAEAGVPLLPTPTADDAEAVDRLDEGGFGLGIVATLTKGHCGVHPTRLSLSEHSGKGVWFAVPALSGAVSYVDDPFPRPRPLQVNRE
ncbi:ATP-binding protein [Microbispora triticiradicis]|uniref:ATP-binding protein n=2 Tax=Microbispora TaxID=2005 RepID=A0ABY3LWA1_9ACTN|nr:MULTISPECIES: ATP-binding protein [Microbispora]TLP63890.1 ATP-binding protein [Microbispora fusca]TYB57560.1 ATP-binding protein [Microbispora tritici]